MIKSVYLGFGHLERPPRPPKFQMDNSVYLGFVHLERSPRPPKFQMDNAVYLGFVHLERPGASRFGWPPTAPVAAARVP